MRVVDASIMLVGGEYKCPNHHDWWKIFIFNFKRMGL